MNVSYILHMPLWSRLKLLLGWGLRVQVEGDRIGNVTTYVVGEEQTLRTLLSVKVNDD
jgi:hypothetical protein